MHVHFDGVKETTATAGLGDRVLAGATTGYRTFLAAGAADGDLIPATIRLQTEWEAGVYRYNAGANSLTPVEIHASSNAGALVNFSAGSKDVTCGPLAKHIINPIPAFPFTSATGLMLRVNALLSRSDFTARGYASKIYDLSGLARHSNVNATNPPKYIHRGYLGELPAWFFNGAHRMIFPGVPQLLTPLKVTIYGIGSAWGAPSGNSHIYNYAGSPIGFSATTSLEFMYNGTLPAAHPDSSAIVNEHRPDGMLGHPVAFIHAYDGAASINSVNGVEQVISPGIGSTGVTNSFTIGGDSSTGGGSYNRMLLLELGVIDHALSVLERARLNEYMRAMGRMKY